MPEQKSRRPRSTINALKIVNSLRAEQGLPKALLKPKSVVITPAEKQEIAREEALKLFPDLSAPDFIWNEKNAALLNKAVEERILRIKSGKEEKPQVNRVQEAKTSLPPRSRSKTKK
jgi:hypothetical protein